MTRGPAWMSRRSAGSAQTRFRQRKLGCTLVAAPSAEALLRRRGHRPSASRPTEARALLVTWGQLREHRAVSADSVSRSARTVAGICAASASIALATASLGLRNRSKRSARSRTARSRRAEPTGPLLRHAARGDAPAEARPAGRLGVCSSRASPGEASADTLGERPARLLAEHARAPGCGQRVELQRRVLLGGRHARVTDQVGPSPRRRRRSVGRPVPETLIAVTGSERRVGGVGAAPANVAESSVSATGRSAGVSLPPHVCHAGARLSRAAAPASRQ